MLRILRCTYSFDYIPAKAAALPWIGKWCLIFQLKYSISPWVSQCQMWLANVLCRSCHNATQDICRGFCSAHEVRSYASKCCGIATNSRVGVSYSDTHTPISMASPDIIAKWDWQIYRAWSVVTRLRTDPEDFPVYLKVDELWFVIVLTSKCERGFRLAVHHKFATYKRFEAICCIMLNNQLMPWIVR